MILIVSSINSTYKEGSLEEDSSYVIMIMIKRSISIDTTLKEGSLEDDSN